MSQQISVMLADRSDLMLVGEWSALLKTDEFDIVASLATFPKLLEFATHFQPQVIILDEGLEPGKSIYDMFNLLQADCFQAKIMVIGTLMDGLYVRDLFHLGIIANSIHDEPICRGEACLSRPNFSYYDSSQLTETAIVATYFVPIV